MKQKRDWEALPKEMRKPPSPRSCAIARSAHLILNHWWTTRRWLAALRTETGTAAEVFQTHCNHMNEWMKRQCNATEGKGEESGGCLPWTMIPIQVCVSVCVIEEGFKKSNHTVWYRVTTKTTQEVSWGPDDSTPPQPYVKRASAYRRVMTHIHITHTLCVCVCLCQGVEIEILSWIKERRNL